MITSVHNPKIQNVRKLLANARERHQQQAFIVEGVRLAEEALNAGWKAQLVLFTDGLEGRGQALVDAFSAGGAQIEQVSQAVMQAVSDTQTPQGVLVILAQQDQPLPANPDFLLILDGLRDPGNLGTVLRSAQAAGVQAVLLAPGCADAWSPKVLRAGMGAHFRLPIHNLDWDEIERYLERASAKIHVYLADSGSQGIPHTHVDFRPPTAIVVGGEAAGAGSRADALAEGKLQIPMPGGSESLNAAVAASILLFEVVRQRTKR